jgi:hypothetical protein
LHIFIIRGKFVGRETSNQINAGQLENTSRSRLGITAIPGLVDKAILLPGTTQAVQAK